jgi:hypothetical protein
VIHFTLPATELTAAAFTGKAPRKRFVFRHCPETRPAARRLR